MENYKKNSYNSQEQRKEDAVDLIFDMVFKSAIENGVINKEEMTLEQFKKMSLRDVLIKLKEKGINTFEITF